MDPRRQGRPSWLSFPASSSAFSRSFANSSSFTNSILLIYISFLIASLLEIRIIAQYLFLVVLIPIMLIKQIYDWQIGQMDRFGFSPKYSVIFFASAIYLISSALSGITLKEFGISLEIMLFLLVTGILVSSNEDFLNQFFAVMCFIVGLHALTEIILWLPIVATVPVIDGYSLSGIRLGQNRATFLSTLYAIFLVACLASLSTGFISAWHRLTLVSSALVLSCAVLFTQTRSGYVAVLGGITAVLSGSSRVMRRVAVAAAIILVILLISVPALRDALWLRGDSYRFEAWSYYLQLAENRPLLGYGSIDLGFKADDGFPIAHSHNLILSAQLRGGILGALAMATMLFGGLYYAARYAKLTGSTLPLAIIVTVILAGMFNLDIRVKRFFHWQILFFWLPVGVCIGTELYIKGRNAFFTRKSARDDANPSNAPQLSAPIGKVQVETQLPR